MFISTMRQRPAKASAKPGTLPSAGLRYQLGQPDQVVGGGSEGKAHPIRDVPDTFRTIG
jgi:hypothetical protein